MTDFHSHILPNMDDGSRSPEESEAMLRESARQGVSLIVATPHYVPEQESPASFLRRRADAYAALPPFRGCPQILLGAEVAFFRGISRCETLDGLNVENTKLLLLEMPFRPWTDNIVDEVCAIRTHTGFTPVLAHFERYRRTPGFSDYMARMRHAGVLVQSDADFFLNFFTARTALKCLRSGGIDFVGSDCHDMHSRRPNLGVAMQRVPEISELCLAPYFLCAAQKSYF